jgi:hypothetical protein
MAPFSAQFESKQISADELEHYLKTAGEEARAAEARALARADQGVWKGWGGGGVRP